MQIKPNRRNFLTTGISFLTVALSTQAAQAGVGRRSDRASEEFKRQLDAVRYSQADFLKLSRKELTYLHNYKVDGFMDAMASNLVKMMLSDRRSTKKLILDLSKLENDKARRKRLVTEVKNAIDLETDAKHGNQGQTDRLRQAKIYKRGVKTWLRHPREGALSISRPIVYRIQL